MNSAPAVTLRETNYASLKRDLQARQTIKRSAASCLAASLNSNNALPYGIMHDAWT
jgi:hypothetical protein